MIEAVELRFLPDRSRHSSADRVPVKRETAEGNGRLLNYEGRDSSLLLPNGDTDNGRETERDEGEQ